MQCEATSKASGERCRRRAVTGTHVCQIHGGTQPRGIASPNHKTGRYSKYLPTRLAARYKAAKSDPDLIALSEELALTDARLADLLGRVDTGEAGLLWRAITKAVEGYRMAQSKGPKFQAERDRAFDMIEQLAAEGRDDYAAWDEVHRLVEQRRKLAETEAKRLKELQQTITAERAMLLVGAVVGVIRAHVHDRDTLAAISRDVGRLIAGGDEPATGPGDGNRDIIIPAELDALPGPAVHRP